MRRAAAPTVLNVALVPNQNQQKVFASVGPLGTYLKRALSVTINLTVPANYAAVVQGMASGRVDVAYFGGLTYEQAKKFVPCAPIVTAAHGGVTTYHSLIIVPANSPYHLITDLAGQKITFAFGDPSSTSGHLYPLVGLNDAGINPDKDFAHVRFTGNHQAAALAVENGAAQVGAVEDDILAQLEKQGVVDATKIRVVWESASIPGYPWVAREALGATTILRLLNRFLLPDSGQVLVGGRDLATLSGRDTRALRRDTGIIYQQHNLVTQLRVLHNVLAGRLGSWSTLGSLGSLVAPAAARGDMARPALAAVGLEGQIDAITADLSGGQQQRVAIARVLVQDPTLILADEPVASLDPRTASDVLETLLRVQRQSGKTLLVSIHNVDLVRRHFSRVIGLTDGCMVFDGRPDDLNETTLATIYGARRAEAIEG